MLGGRLKKKWFYFLVPFIVILLVWQFREVAWMRKDVPFSPGRALTEELRPIVRGSPFYGYRLDLSTLEELNFYLDPDAPVSNFKKAEDLLNQAVKKKEEGFYPHDKEPIRCARLSEGSADSPHKRIHVQKRRTAGIGCDSLKRGFPR